MFNAETFDSFVYTTVSESISQRISLFNEASMNTLRLINGMNVGDKDHTLIFKQITDLVKRRDTTTNGAISAKDLSQGDLSSIRVAGGTYPVNIPPGDFDWIAMDPERGAMIVGEQLIDGMVADQLNTVIMCLVAYMTAIGAPSAEGALDGVVHDISALTGGSEKISHIGLNTAASLFGDASDRIAVWLMHSTPAHALYGDALANANQLFKIGNVSIKQDGFGRSYIITDSPSLSVGSGVYNTLGLTVNAATVETNPDFRSFTEQKTGTENLQIINQSQWSYNVGLKGGAYTDNTTSPSNAALSTPGNYAQVVSSIKSTSGVLFKHKI